MRHSIPWGGLSSRKRKSRHPAYLKTLSSSQRCRYLIVDWERRNFSISQCRFSVNSQQDLVAIVPSNDSMESGSSTGRTVGIAVGVVVAVVVIAVTIGVFFFLRWRNRRRNENYTATKIDEDSNDQIRQGFKGELSTGLDNQRFEMAGSDPKGVQAEHDAAPSGWVDEKGRYPGDRSGIAEVAGGDVSISELPSQSPARQPLHEMYDPSAQPVELPAAEIGELQGSTPAVSSRNSIVSSPRSANRSPFDKQGPSLMNRLSGRRSSNHEPLPGPGPPDRTAPKPSEGPRTPKRTGTANTAVISPVSKEGTTSPDDTRQPSQGLNEIISPVSSDDSAEASRRFWQRIMGK